MRMLEEYIYYNLQAHWDSAFTAALYCCYNNTALWKSAIKH